MKIDRVFTVIDKEQKSPRYLDTYSCDQKRIFLKYKNGMCSRLVIGKNTFDQISFRIATYLELSNVIVYTGHWFRHFSGNMLADADNLSLWLPFCHSASRLGVKRKHLIMANLPEAQNNSENKVENIQLEAQIQECVSEEETGENENTADHDEPEKEKYS